MNTSADGPTLPRPETTTLEAVVRLALLQSAEMHDLEDRAREISARTAKLTPLPQKPTSVAEPWNV